MSHWFTYHYYATTEVAPGTVQHVDGVLALSSMVATNTDYAMVRTKISDNMTCPVEKLTIRSLTLLNPH